MSRIIPCIAVLNGEAWQTRNFVPVEYLGDALNILTIFNQFLPDEVNILNLGDDIDFKFFEKLSSESSCPLSFQGSVRKEQDIEFLIEMGYERIGIGSTLFSKVGNDLIQKFGSSSLFLCVDYRYINEIPVVFTNSGKRNTTVDLKTYLDSLFEKIPIPSEVLLYNIDRDGNSNGLDLKILEVLSQNSNYIMKGGLSSYEEVNNLIKNNVSSIGSFLFTHGPKKDGILLNYNVHRELYYFSKFRYVIS